MVVTRFLSCKDLPQYAAFYLKMFVCHLGLPWQTNNILVKYDQPPEKPYSAAVCRDLPGRKRLLINCDSVMEKAKYGKMRQVNAVNGSQMVVKLRGSYYRWVKG